MDACIFRSNAVNSKEDIFPRLGAEERQNARTPLAADRPASTVAACAIPGKEADRSRIASHLMQKRKVLWLFTGVSSQRNFAFLDILARNMWNFTTAQVSPGYHPPSERRTGQAETGTNQHNEAESKDKGLVNGDADGGGQLGVEARRNC